MELGIYTFGELTPDPHTGRQVTPAERMHDLLEEVDLADRLGARCLRRRRAPPPNYIVSAPAVVLGAAPARTNDIRLASAVNIISSDDPVHVFQQTAIAIPQFGLDTR